jgi:Calcineurin-like phosphoesterase
LNRAAWVLLVAVIAAAAACGEQAPEPGDTVESRDGYRRGPYLAQGGPEEMTLVWRRIGEGEPKIRLGRDPRTLEVVDPDLLVRTLGKDTGGLSSAPEGCVQVEATFDDLDPDTLYHYEIRYGRTLFAGGPERTFRTSPEPGTRRPFRFWVLGDSGTGGPEQAAVHEAMRAVVAAEGVPPDFILHVGDLAYPAGTDDQFHTKYFAPYEKTLANTVCWPAIGNHDGHYHDCGIYRDAFVLPTEGECGGEASGTELYYSFNYANTHVVVLDSCQSNRDFDGPMLRWLEVDLADSDAEWLIAMWHHPPYSKGSHDAERGVMRHFRRVVLPVLERHGVDLVFTGHSHIYERSMLLNGAYAAPNTLTGVIFDDGDGDPDGEGAYLKSGGRKPNEGAVYVVTGHGGGKLNRLGTSRVMKRVIKDFGSVLVDVNGDTLDARMIDREGEVRDRFRIVKRGTVVPNAVENPRELPPYHYLGEEVAVLTLRLREDLLGPCRAVVEIPTLPEGVTAKLDWEVTGTAWSVLEPSALLTPDPEFRTRHEFNPLCTGSPFPLPKVRLTYLTEQGEQAGKLTVVVPPYRRLHLKPLATEPRIDGTPTSGETAELPPQSALIREDGGGPAKSRTTFFLGVAGEHLYFAANCRTGDGAPPGPGTAEELILHLTEGRMSVNLPLSPFQKPGEPHTVATALTAGGWSVEALIPLTTLGGLPPPGEAMRLNVIRTADDGERSEWSWTGEGEAGDPGLAGALMLFR